MGKEQAAEGIKRGMDNLVSFTNFFYCMDMQEIGFQHCQDKAQAVGRIGDQHFGKKGMGMSAVFAVNTNSNFHCGCND